MTETKERHYEFLRDFGIPSRCPFTGNHPPTLAREWARGYAEGSAVPQQCR